MSDDGSALPMGCRIGRYQVQEVLGAGTFGFVYRCEEIGPRVTVALREYLPPATALRDVDLSVRPLTAASQDPFDAGLADFTDRARRMASVDHPGLARILEVFEANGTAYVAMDYARGKPLSTIVGAGGRLGPEEVVRCLGPVVDGLAQMHGMGLVHGSLGLGSVVVDDAGNPVLLGLAVPARDEFGAVLKAGYAPLERYSANAGLLGPQTDVYALGAILYRCVTGVTPPEAPIRAERDTLAPATRSAARGIFGATLLGAIDEALAMDPHRRPPVEAMREAMVAPEPPRERRVAEAAQARRAFRRVREETPRAGHGRPGGRESRSGRGPDDSRRRALAGLGLGVAAVVAGAALLGVFGGGEGETPIPVRPGPGAVAQEPSVVEPARRAEDVGREVAGALDHPAPEGEPVAARPVASDDTADQAPSSPEVETEVAGAAAVAAATTAPVTPPHAPTASVVLDGVPPGAEVYIDGVSVGTAPLQVDGVAPGGRRLVIRHPHYETHEVELALAAGDRVRFEGELARATGGLEIRARPATAWVEANGIRVADGMPAIVRDLPAGPLAVTIGATGYATAVVDAVVRKDRTEVVEVALARAFGTLTLDVIPNDAAIELLDVDDSYRPGVRLPEGSHRIAITRPGYETLTQTVPVAGDTRHRVALAPAPQPFTVVARPADATVEFLEPGVTYSPGMPLAAGTYRLQAVLLGYATWSGAVRHGTVPTTHEVTLAFEGGEYTDALASGGAGPVMAVVPAGAFEMGCLAEACSSQELPVRTVTFGAPFAMSKFEVTFDEFDRYVSATGAPRPSDAGWGRALRPVINVSWEEAAAYADWLARETGRGYRLPSEAEWEYAARAGTATPFAFGGPDCAEANCGGSARRTRPVGAHRGNDWGLHDMHGNVWEWAMDCANESYAGAPEDGSAWLAGNCDRRILRGGSWYNDGAAARSASRLSGQRGVRGHIAGFRVVAVD